MTSQDLRWYRRLLHKGSLFLLYASQLARRHRSYRTDRDLALIMATVAGAVNAGGFMVVGQYTSHMSGIVSAMADALAVGAVKFYLAGLVSLLAFMSGAAVSAIMISWAKMRHLEAVYAGPLILEGVLFLLFALLGENVARHAVIVIPVTVIVLCFLMGLQNAMISKLSDSVIRTTHVTGMVTDLGIEIGKMLFWRQHRDATYPVRANKRKLIDLLRLVTCFFMGGVAGALSFSRFGFICTLPLAALLIAIGILPIMVDVRIALRHKK